MGAAKRVGRRLVVVVPPIPTAKRSAPDVEPEPAAGYAFRDGVDLIAPTFYILADRAAVAFDFSADVQYRF